MGTLSSEATSCRNFVATDWLKSARLRFIVSWTAAIAIGAEVGAEVAGGVVGAVVGVAVGAMVTVIFVATMATRVTLNC